MSLPQVPPRPARTQHHAKETSDAPMVPPRPERRPRDRTQSPTRDNFPRSPLNDMPLGMSHSNVSGGMYSAGSQNASSSSLGLPNRPPSVSLPSIGQEGNEYADIAYESSESPAMDRDMINEPAQTRNVGSDLPLHAPRPSFSDSTAKARVSAVTRTDSTQAAVAGIGKIPTPINDDRDPQLRNLRAKGSFPRADSSASTERPGSAQAGDGDHGIPEIPGVGQRVPMYPDAGDVQAPSPSPYSQNFPSGVGFHNQGAKPRHHKRTKSGREIIPPGSYGLHGHGVPNTDQFEKAWYDKHPEALQREGYGQYGPGINATRGESALSSEDLNKLVRETRSAGFGTSPGVAGLPNEQIGYMASEEYQSRLSTPHSATGFYHKAHSNHSQTLVESPLRKTSFAIDAQSRDVFDKSHQHDKQALHSAEDALESETEDEEVHVDAPAHRKDKLTGNGYDPPTEDLGPEGGNTKNQGGWIEERGYGVPILASDEVAKEPGSEYLQPAISPAQERRGSNYYSGVDSEAPPSYQSGFRNGSRSGSASNSRPTSRPTSRPGSLHGSLPGLPRFTSVDDREDMHTPLADVEEYEPLFPDEEGKVRSIPAAERFKRREMKRFPSQDIWEDTPNSLQLQATVNTPEPAEPQTAQVLKSTSTTYETPEAEKARKGEVAESDKAKLIPKEERLLKSTFKPHLREEMTGPGMKQRFPSRDIWEDSPDSARLETTVGGPQNDTPTSPPASKVQDEGLIAGAVVSTSGRSDIGTIGGEQARDGVTAGAAAVAKPSIPPRPQGNKTMGQPAEISGQAPPSVPVRPPKRIQNPPIDAEVPIPPPKTSKEASPLEAKQPSPTDSRKAPVLPERPKPDIPPRPANPIARDSSESIPLSKVTSAASAGSSVEEEHGLRYPPPAPKPKPAVPSRPAGGKIAALKAGFLSDLDKRLQLGPQGSKPQEKAQEDEEEKAPLADARKGRARGPARRKPAASPAAIQANSVAATEQKDKADPSQWAMKEAWTVWAVGDDGLVDVAGTTSESPSAAEEKPRQASNSVPERTPLQAYSDSMKDSTFARVTETAQQLESSSPGPLATLAKETSISNEPVSLDQAKATQKPDAGSSPAATTTEISNEPSTEKLPPPPSAYETADSMSQTGEKDITANAGTEAEEKTTAIVGGKAQAHDGGDVLTHQEPVANENL